jgi:hypothetical protein
MNKSPEKSSPAQEKMMIETRKLPEKRPGKKNDAAGVVPS